MKIGILTFYRVVNFGANLQALSTYRYLEKRGHTPIMINYQSVEMQKTVSQRLQTDKQAEAHLRFTDTYLPSQTMICSTPEELNKTIIELGITKVIIGSDAVIQHHPLLSRIHRGRRKPIYVEKMIPERMFPNPFWGDGFPEEIKIALMSASSQNSRYDLFSRSLRKKMQMALSKFSYISVRDSWTQDMLRSITGISYTKTPDPVFAFNQNVGDIIPSKEECLQKYKLPENYVLVSLMRQSLSTEVLLELKSLFKMNGLDCVSLPMPTGHGFQHNFDYNIQEPLDSLDWYAIIKYASGYIGSNMHPIIVCLHNGVPCYSIDNWGTLDFFNRRLDNGSSKVEDIMRLFGVERNHSFISVNRCNVVPSDIVNAIISFPKESVLKKSQIMYKEYQKMMNDILNSFDTFCPNII